MDFVAVSERLAARAATVDGIMAADSFVPESVTVPHFYVGEWTFTYDQTYGGLVDAEVVCRILCSRSDIQAGQDLLRGFMAPTGATSLKAALEAEPTLGGECMDLHVRLVRGHRLYQVGDARYYGAEWPVRILGEE